VIGKIKKIVFALQLKIATVLKTIVVVTIDDKKKWAVLLVTNDLNSKKEAIKMTHAINVINKIISLKIGNPIFILLSQLI
jgi:hypothetical protein